MLSPSASRSRAPLAALIAVALVALVAGLVVGLGDDGPGGGDGGEAKPVDHLIGQLVRVYPERQRDNGHYRSPVGGGTRYGNAYMGYAMLMHSVRAGSERSRRSGLHGLTNTFVTGRVPNRPSVFEILALAGGYNLAREHFADDPVFRRHRGAWEDFLRRAELIRLPAESHYGNHWLIEVVEIQELLRTGLRSSSPTAVLGGQRESAIDLSRRLVNRRIPDMAREEAVPVPGGRAFVLSDPPDNPLAYQGLSLGYYARAVELLGDDAAPVARRTLAEIARASLHLAAPDGDIAYFGRNQEQAWGLAGTAYGAYYAASLDETPPDEDARLLELAERTLRRLGAEHGVSHWGLNITPSLARSRFVPPAGLDPGAGGPSFGGLVFGMLEWARPYSKEAPAGATLPADRPLRAKLSHSESRFAVIRRGPVWAAIRPTTSGKYPYDVRYDFGVVAMKVLRDGRWTDVMRPRPFTAAAADSAGPVLLTGGVKAFPFATEVGLERDGTVVMRGGWRRESTRTKRVVATLPNGGTVRGLSSTPGAPVRTDVLFRFEPQPCGIRMTFPVQAGDTIEYSAFLLPNGARAGRRSFQDDVQRVTFDRPASGVVSEEGYGSGTDPALVRSRATFDALAAGPLAVTHCAQSGPLRREVRAAPMTRG